MIRPVMETEENTDQDQIWEIRECHYNLKQPYIIPVRNS